MNWNEYFERKAYRRKWFMICFILGALLILWNHKAMYLSSTTTVCSAVLTCSNTTTLSSPTQVFAFSCPSECQQSSTAWAKRFVYTPLVLIPLALLAFILARTIERFKKVKEPPKAT